MSNTSINNRMEQTPIPNLIIKSSVPLMISTLVSSLYGLVDSMYVSRLSENALTATTISLAIFVKIFALCASLAPFFRLMVLHFEWPDI